MTGRARAASDGPFFQAAAAAWKKKIRDFRKKCLTMDAVRAIVIKHSGVHDWEMPEWRNWQTPGT